MKKLICGVQLFLKQRMSAGVVWGITWMYKNIYSFVHHFYAVESDLKCINIPEIVSFTGEICDQGQNAYKF